MDRVLLIYNPMAGIREFNGMLDETIAVFQERGIDLSIYRTREQMDFYNYLQRDTCEPYRAVLVAGGDGSVSLALNAMMNKGIRMPLGIIPAGTSNDFANYLGISTHLKEAVRQLSAMRTRWIDVGKANDTYFINVCGGGIIPNVAHKVDREAKNNWGKAAYYVAGLMEMGRNQTFRILITTEDEVYEEEVFLFLVMNGASAGGFAKLGVRASADDGRLDLVAIKSISLADVPLLFTKIMRGDHFDDRHVRYLSAERFHIDFLSGSEDTRRINIDGEEGPEYPLDIRVFKRSLEILY